MPSTFLNSWKEIANYLGRSVRTAQRWEIELGMPVRHPRNTKRGPVLAVPAEIDAWLQRAAVRPVYLQSGKTADLCLAAGALKEHSELLRHQLQDNLNRAMQLTRAHQHKAGIA